MVISQKVCYQSTMQGKVSIKLQTDASNSNDFLNLNKYVQVAKSLL